MLVRVCERDKVRQRVSVCASELWAGQQVALATETCSPYLCRSAVWARYLCGLRQFGLVAEIDKLSASQDTPVSLEALKDSPRGDNDNHDTHCIPAT